MVEFTLKYVDSSFTESQSSIIRKKIPNFTEL